MSKELNIAILKISSMKNHKRVADQGFLGRGHPRVYSEIHTNLAVYKKTWVEIKMC